MLLAEFVAHCRLAEIYAGFRPGTPPDMQGWGSQHRVFAQIIAEIRPASIIEVGSWKGASAIHMQTVARSLGLAPAILCIDTWLGGERAYVDHSFIDDTLPRGGRLRLLEIFMTNVTAAGFQDAIFPMPSTSADGADSLACMNVLADLIYIDADHSEAGARRDLEDYWPVLRPGGAMIGDDYDPETWPGVIAAADGFARARGLPIEIVKRKFVLRKPA